MTKNESNRSLVQDMIARTAKGAFLMPEVDEPVEIPSSSIPSEEERAEPIAKDVPALPERPRKGRRSAPKSQIASIEEYAEVYFSTENVPDPTLGQQARIHIYPQIAQALSIIARIVGHIPQTQYINNILREHLKEHSALLNAELEKQKPPTIDL